MKKLACVLAILCLAVPVRAQAAHFVTLTFVDADTGVTFNMYRAPGACPATVSPGTYCYAATAVAGSNESAGSNLAGASIKPGVVTITVTVAQ